MALTVPRTRASSAGRKSDEGHHEQAGIEVFGTVILDKRVELGVKALVANLPMDGAPQCFPPCCISRDPARFC